MTKSAHFKNPVHRLLVVALATGLGVGYSPILPGTLGSVLALPLLWRLQSEPFAVQAGFWSALFIAGVWAAREFSAATGSRDSSRIVIDEVLGMGVAGLALQLSSSILVLALAFFIFRIFDIAKPPPVRQLDRWSKNKTGWAGGFGVIADDLLAGAMTLFVLAAAIAGGLIA